MKTLATIGFTGKSLRTFVELLQAAGVSKVIDVRLRNASQLAGYAKKDDLAFVLGLCDIEYEHVPALAPTDELLDGYRLTKDWKAFERKYRARLRRLQPIGALLSAAAGHDRVCLLCSEDSPEHCHRRLLAEYAQKQVPLLALVHLEQP
jgi:uncharacterized protein (DUF488 family)